MNARDPFCMYDRHLLQRIDTSHWLPWDGNFTFTLWSWQRTEAQTDQPLLFTGGILLSITSYREITTPQRIQTGWMSLSYPWTNLLSWAEAKHLVAAITGSIHCKLWNTKRGIACLEVWIPAHSLEGWISTRLIEHQGLARPQRKIEILCHFHKHFL